MEAGDNKIVMQEDISNILKLAKLTETDIHSCTQMLYFCDEDSNESQYKLLQLDTYLENEIREGATILIKGDDDENAVLCTNDRTYDVVEGETSNSMLLVQNVLPLSLIENEKENSRLHHVTISHIAYEVFEIVPSRPRIQKVIKLLQKSLYRGPEYESDVDTSTLVTRQELSDLTQASEREFQCAIDSLAIVEIDNRVRLLHPTYHFRALSHMLRLIDENSWDLHEIDYDETISSLQNLIRTEIINALFEKYTNESNIIGGIQYYSYKEREVCALLAQWILQGHMKFDEFLEMWKGLVPIGMVPTEDMLYGIAVVDKSVEPHTICHLNKHDLPDDVHDRFKVLFKAKPKWTIAEITPYILSLVTHKMDVHALLVKFARSSMHNGIKYFSTKHAK